MIVATNYLRFFLIAVAATAVVHGQNGQNGVVVVVGEEELVVDFQLEVEVDVEIIEDIVVDPLYPLTEVCNPCRLHDDAQALIEGCAGINPIVAEIIARESGCGRIWDPFCLVEYNDCYNQACGADLQELVAEIVAVGGPNLAGEEPRPLNRDQIRCPITPGPTPRPTPATPAPSPRTTEEATVEPTVCPPGKGGKKGGYYGGRNGGKKGGYYGGKGGKKGGDDGGRNGGKKGGYYGGKGGKKGGDDGGRNGGKKGGYYGGKGGKKGGYDGGRNGDCYYSGKKTGKKGYTSGGSRTGKKGYDADYYDFYYGGKKGGKKGGNYYDYGEDTLRVDVVFEEEVDVKVVVVEDVEETVIKTVNTNVAAIEDFAAGVTGFGGIGLVSF